MVRPFTDEQIYTLKGLESAPGSRMDDAPYRATVRAEKAETNADVLDDGREWQSTSSGAP